MRICVSDLNKIKEGGFLKSKIAENAILLLVCNSFTLIAKQGDSDGYDPTGDGYIGSHKIEVKYSAAGTGANGYHIFIETHDRYGNPSGILTSESEYYLTITPGWSSKIGPIGQVRLWKTTDLIEIASQCKRFGYPSGGSGYWLIPKQFDSKQIWVGTIGYHKDTQTFDVSKFIQLGNIYSVRNALCS